MHAKSNTSIHFANRNKHLYDHNHKEALHMNQETNWLQLANGSTIIEARQQTFWTFFHHQKCWCSSLQTQTTLYMEDHMGSFY